jgi:hypothetical protein
MTTSHSPSADPLDGAMTGPARYLVRAADEIDERIAGHTGIAYASPPQALADALALVRLLLGGPVDNPQEAADGPARSQAGGAR